MMRGVMLPQMGITREKNGELGHFITGGHHSLCILPSAILYWDKIFAPINYSGAAPHYESAVERLMELGIAESIHLGSEDRYSTEDINAIFSKCAAIFDELDSRDSEIWSIVPPMPLYPDQETTLAAQSLPYLPENAQTTASIEVQLRNALPAPDRDVPYEDLLEFKNSRKDQIQRLHVELSQVAARYVGSMGYEKAMSSALNDVSIAISDLQRVYEEKWTIKATRNLTSAFAMDGVLPAGAAYLLGVEIDKAFLVGAGVAIAKSVVTASMSAKHKDHPYSYALSAKFI